MQNSPNYYKLLAAPYSFAWLTIFASTLKQIKDENGEGRRNVRNIICVVTWIVCQYVYIFSKMVARQIKYRNISIVPNLDLQHWSSLPVCRPILPPYSSTSFLCTWIDEVNLLLLLVSSPALPAASLLSTTNPCLACVLSPPPYQNPTKPRSVAFLTRLQHKKLLGWSQKFESKPVFEERLLIPYTRVANRPYRIKNRVFRYKDRAWQGLAWACTGWTSRPEPSNDSFK